MLRDGYLPFMLIRKEIFWSKRKKVKNNFDLRNKQNYVQLFFAEKGHAFLQK